MHNGYSSGLPERALEWIAGVGSRPVRVREIRRLPGSTSSALYQVRLGDGAQPQDAAPGRRVPSLHRYDAWHSWSNS